MNTVSLTVQVPPTKVGVDGRVIVEIKDVKVEVSVRRIDVTTPFHVTEEVDAQGTLTAVTESSLRQSVHGLRGKTP